MFLIDFLARVKVNSVMLIMCLTSSNVITQLCCERSENREQVRKSDTCGVIVWPQWSLIPVFDVMILTYKPWPGVQEKE